MRPKLFKNLGLIIAIVIAIPVATILGIFSYLYFVSAFPSNSLAAERFRENGNYTFPNSATDIYFRLAAPSPLDRGGSALRFSADPADLLKIVETPSFFGMEWKVLEEDFVCRCAGCIRYSETVTVPSGSSYWMHTKPGGDYVIMAVDFQTNQVFKCALDR